MPRFMEFFREVSDMGIPLPYRMASSRLQSVSQKRIRAIPPLKETIDILRYILETPKSSAELPFKRMYPLLAHIDDHCIAICFMPGEPLAKIFDNRKPAPYYISYRKFFELAERVLDCGFLFLMEEMMNPSSEQDYNLHQFLLEMRAEGRGLEGEHPEKALQIAT